jgi:hypothetical protein
MIPFFSNGHAPFYDGSYWGVVDAKGEIVIRPKYQETFISGNIVGIKDDGKVGFVNLSGDEVIRPEFDAATPFFGKVALAKDGSRWTLIDTKGKSVTRTDFEEIGNPMEQLLRYVAGEFVESDFFDGGSVVGALPLSEASDRAFAGVPAWAAVTEVMAKFGLSEDSLPMNQTAVALPGRVAGPSEYRLNVLFSDPVRTWFSSSPNPQARASGVRMEVDLRGKARERGGDVAQLIVGNLTTALQQYRIVKQDALSDANKVLFANDKGEYIVAVMTSPNRVTVQYQFSADLLGAGGVSPAP